MSFLNVIEKCMDLDISENSGKGGRMTVLRKAIQASFLKTSETGLGTRIEGEKAIIPEK